MRVVVGANFLWLVPPFGTGESTSIPLAWLASASAVGHGLVVGWQNRVAGRPESFVLGVRGALFYQPKERDRLVALLLERAKTAVSPDLSAPTACEVCGSPQVAHYALQRISGLVLVGSAVVEVRVLCSRHAADAIRQAIIRNALLGTLGPFGLRAVRHAFELTRRGEVNGLFGPPVAARLRAASLAIPALMLATLAAFVAFANLVP